MSAITVLIVDDHVMVRKGLRMALEAHEDVSVVGEAGNLHEAIEIATRDGIVDDVFALSSIGQGDLSPGARAHLERALEGACPRTSRPPGFSVLGAAGAPAAPTRSVPARRS